MALPWGLPPSLSIISILLAIIAFSTPFVYSSNPLSILENDSPNPDIHDILPDFNLPKGILPNAVKSYTLSSKDGTFTVEMKHPCYVNFPDNQVVYYGKVIKGKLTYGKVSGVSGIQAKKFFLWVPVTGMAMDAESDMVEFYVGALSQKLPAKQFETIPSCTNKNCSKLNIFRSSS